MESTVDKWGKKNTCFVSDSLIMAVAFTGFVSFSNLFHFLSLREILVIVFLSLSILFKNFSAYFVPYIFAKSCLELRRSTSWHLLCNIQMFALSYLMCKMRRNQVIWRNKGDTHLVRPIKTCRETYWNHSTNLIWALLLCMKKCTATSSSFFFLQTHLTVV